MHCGTEQSLALSDHRVLFRAVTPDQRVMMCAEQHYMIDQQRTQYMHTTAINCSSCRQETALDHRNKDTPHEILYSSRKIQQTAVVCLPICLSAVFPSSCVTENTVHIIDLKNSISVPFVVYCSP